MSAPGGGGDLGTARGKIVIDSSEAEKGVDKATEAVNKFTRQQEAAAGRLKDIGSEAAKLYAGAVVGGFALAINSAKNFEQSLANVKAAGGKDAADQMDKISQKALQLGADTKFSATEAADAMEALIKAGLSVNDVLNGAADAAVNLAAAEGIKIPEAAEIAATAMTAFNLTAAEMPAIANKISQAASATKMDVNDFSYAMNQAGAVSKLVGLSFDDMSLAIVAMGKAGIVGSDAGTSLKTMLMNLQPATKPQRELFEELGLTVDGMNNKFFTAEGRIKSMTEIAGVLADATKGMSEQQKIMTLETLFGSDAIRAGAIISEQGAEGMKKLTAEMESQLSVADKAKVKQDTLSGAMEKMKGSIESAAIKFGTAFIPIVRQVAEFIEKLADGFAKLPAPVQQAIGYFLLGSTALLGFGFAAVKIVNVVKDINTVLRIGAGVKAMGDGLGVLRAAMTMTVGQLKAGAVSMASSVKTACVSMATALRSAATAATTAAASAGRAMVAWAVSTAQATARVIASLALAAAAHIRSFAVMIAQAVIAGAQMVATAAIQVAGWIRMAAVAMANALIMAAAWLIANPWILIIAAIIALVIFIVANWDKIKEFLLSVWNAIKDFAISVWNGIVQGIAAAWQWVKDTASTIWNAIADFFVQYWPYILGIFTGGIGLVVGLIIQNWDTVKQFVIDVWTAISDFFVSIWNTIVSSVTTFVTNVYTTIRDGMVRANEIVSEKIRSVIQFFRELPGQIMDALSNMVGNLTNIGRNMMEGLINGVKAVAGRIKDAVLGPIKDSVNAVKSFLGISSPAKLTFEIGSDFGQGYVNALLKKRAEVKAAMTTMVQGGVSLTSSQSPLVSSAAAATGAATMVTSASPGPTTIVNNYQGPITIPVQGNLDPTDPVKWRQTMGAIKDGIRNADREYA